MARNWCNYEQFLSNKGIFTALWRAERIGWPQMKEEAAMDNFLLENNHVLWGKKEKHSNPQYVIFMASDLAGAPKCRQEWAGEDNGDVRQGWEASRHQEEEEKVKREKKFKLERVLTEVCSPVLLDHSDSSFVHFFPKSGNICGDSIAPHFDPSSRSCCLKFCRPNCFLRGLGSQQLGLAPPTVECQPLHYS